MTIRSESDYAATIGTAITLQQEKGAETVEESLDKSMAPNFIMVAFSASRRPLPHIFPALLKYFLENNRNKDYHLFVFFCWVSLDPFVWGGEVLLNFTVRLFDIKKGPPKETNKFAKYN
jgi:hypothetical protein